MGNDIQKSMQKVNKLLSDAEKVNVNNELTIRQKEKQITLSRNITNSNSLNIQIETTTPYNYITLTPPEIKQLKQFLKQF